MSLSIRDRRASTCDVVIDGRPPVVGREPTGGGVPLTILAGGLGGFAIVVLGAAGVFAGGFGGSFGFGFFEDADIFAEAALLAGAFFFIAIKTPISVGRTKVPH